jgi:predicted secreted protein
MKVNIKTDLVTNISSDVITLGVDDKNQLIDSSRLDKKTVSYLNNVIALGDISEKLGSVRVVHGNTNFKFIFFS